MHRTIDGATPLLVAANGGYVIISQILLENGAEPNVKNNDGEAALHRLLAHDWAPSDDNSALCSLARLLLRHGANVNDKYKDHTTPLHRAMKRRSCEIAQILLEHNAQPNVVNKDGKTALHLVLEPKYYYKMDDAEILTASLCGYYCSTARM
jgi:ankyrin repeat protein